MSCPSNIVVMNQSDRPSVRDKLSCGLNYLCNEVGQMEPAEMKKGFEELHELAGDGIGELVGSGLRSRHYGEDDPPEAYAEDCWPFFLARYANRGYFETLLQKHRNQSRWDCPECGASYTSLLPAVLCCDSPLMFNNKVGEYFHIGKSLRDGGRSDNYEITGIKENGAVDLASENGHTVTLFLGGHDPLRPLRAWVAANYLNIGEASKDPDWWENFHRRDPEGVPAPPWLSDEARRQQVKSVCAAFHEVLTRKAARGPESLWHLILKARNCYKILPHLCEHLGLQTIAAASIEETLFYFYMSENQTGPGSHGLNAAWAVYAAAWVAAGRGVAAYGPTDGDAEPIAACGG